MPDNRTSRMHYAPVLLLRHFTDYENNLHEYHIQEKRWRKSGPRGVGYEHCMYTDDVEDWFKCQIENPVGPVFKKVRDGDVNLTHDQKLKIARFIAAQVIRTPFAREKTTREYSGTVDRVIQNPEFVASTLEILLPLIHKRPTLTTKQKEDIGRFASQLSKAPDEASPGIRDQEKAFPFHLQQEMLGDEKPTYIGKQAVEFYMRLAWRVIQAETEAFILSDNPVLMTFDARFGVDDPQIECVLPISKSTAIHLGRDGIVSGEGVELITGDKYVRTINSRTLSNAYRCVYSSRRDNWINKNASRKSVRHRHLSFSHLHIDVQYGRPPCPDCETIFSSEQWDSWEGEAPPIRGYKGVPPHSCL